jgi:hypothetical protein
MEEHKIMKFAVNRYNIIFHAVITDPPPIAGAQIEQLLFGLPPFEVRPIWTIDIRDLAQLTELIESLGVSMDVSKSAYWTGSDFRDPGQRLFGISLIDDPSYKIDPRDRPIKIIKRGE